MSPTEILVAVVLPAIYAYLFGYMRGYTKASDHERWVREQKWD